MGRGSDLAGNGSSFCLQQPVAISISISMENQLKPFQLSWHFSVIPVMFKSILCLISS